MACFFFCFLTLLFAYVGLCLFIFARTQKTGLGYGLGAANSVGNEVRDYRQESEIQRSKAELEQAKVREAELESRIKALEEGQQAPALPAAEAQQ